MWRSRPTLIHACRRMSAVDLGTRNTLRSRQVSVSATAHELGPNATASGAFSFELVHRSRKAGSKARVGIIHTPHGDIATPGFVPVATSAALKHLPPSLTPSEVDLMFCNTYHLLLHPGPEVVGAAGGLHKFMNRSKPIITDSGGFQVFSLAYGSVHEELTSHGQPLLSVLDDPTLDDNTKDQILRMGAEDAKHERARPRRGERAAAGSVDLDGSNVMKRRRPLGTSSVLKVSENGVLFSSYRDGAKILLTPESSVECQKKLGADIIIPLDELPPYHTSPEALRESLARTHRWELRSLQQHLKNANKQAMYAVVHGGLDQGLRRESLEYLTSLPFDGLAIGGSVGKTKDDLVHLMAFLTTILPDELPRHLLGIGDLQCIDRCVPFGVDTFDSSYPTRSARHGTLYTSDGGELRIHQALYREQFEPLEHGCHCWACTHHTRAYLHHLFKACEPAYFVLATQHNIIAYMRRMQQYRERILANDI